MWIGQLAEVRPLSSFVHSSVAAVGIAFWSFGTVVVWQFVKLMTPPLFY